MWLLGRLPRAWIRVTRNVFAMRLLRTAVIGRHNSTPSVADKAGGHPLNTRDVRHDIHWQRQVTRCCDGCKSQKRVNRDCGPRTRMATVASGPRSARSSPCWTLRRAGGRGEHTGHGVGRTNGGRRQGEDVVREKAAAEPTKHGVVPPTQGGC